MAYATVTDVVVEMGRPASGDAEEGQWGSWLRRVEATIARRFARLGKFLADEIDAGRVDLQDVKDVEVAVVARRARADALMGLTSVTRQIDDASITERRESGDGGADSLSLTSEEWDILLPDAGTGRARIFSVMPS